MESTRFRAAATATHGGVWATAGSTSYGAVGPIEGGKDRLQAVIVFLRDRIELVVVAAGALHGEAAKRVEGRGDHVVAVEVAGDPAVDLGLRHFRMADEVPRPGRDETGRLDAVARVGLEHVAGQLFLDELPIRPVLVERADQIIAIGPGIGPRLVLVVAVRLAVVHDVHPVPRPPLAVMRRGQQPIDQLFVGQRILVAHEHVDLVRFRRKSQQIIGEPPNERAPIGLGGTV